MLHVNCYLLLTALCERTRIKYTLVQLNRTCHQLNEAQNNIMSHYLGLGAKIGSQKNYS